MNLRALSHRLERLPMLRAFVPFAAGILLADCYELPVGFLWAGFALTGATALITHSSLYATAALLLAGWGVAALQAPQPDGLPRSIRTVFALRIGDAGEGTITAWRGADGAWYPAAVRVIVRTDSTTAFQPGERLVVRSYLNDLPDSTSYGKLMRHRGFGGRVWLSEKQVLSRRPARATNLHRAAVERLRRLGLPAREQALCAAMAAGDRSGLTPALRKTYARSGTAHLLAVSGLHVGIVFLLANALLGWLPALRRGHLLRNGAAIALIWLYAATAGLSPSVVRAALMFSALQCALASGSAYASGNTLAATAFVMLLFRPSYLFDIGFQLSFVAVAAILAWGVPLCRRLRTGRRPLDLLVDTLVVGAVASAATMPLAAHTFGIAPLLGIVLNPFVLPLAAVVVMASVAWMVFPFPWLVPLLHPVARTAAAWLQTLAEWTAAQPFAAVEWQPGTALTAAIYLLFTGATLVAGCREPKKSVPLGR